MRAGFTLLELLIALALFTLLSAMAFSGLSYSVAITSRFTQEALFRRSLVSAWARIGGDVAQCRDAPEGARDEQGPEPVLTIWPAPGEASPSKGRRERLVKVEYRRIEGSLVRLAWFASPGRTPRSARSIVLEGVEAFTARPTLEEGDRRPRAVAVTLALSGRGTWTRSFECAR